MGKHTETDVDRAPNKQTNKANQSKRNHGSRKKRNEFVVARRSLRRAAGLGRRRLRRAHGRHQCEKAPAVHGTSSSSNGTTTAADEEEEGDATETETETSTLPPPATTTAAGEEDADTEEDASAADANAYNQGSEDCIYGDHPTSLVDTAAATPDFSTLVAALNASGLVGALSDPSTKLTVFAPTNEAFDKLFSDFNVTAEEVLGNTKFLSDVLKYHVVGDVTAFGDLTDGSSLPTLLEGESLGVSTSESTATIYGAFGFPLGTQTAEAVTIIGGATNATVVRGNVWTCNAVVQVIDSVLVPQSAVSAAE